MNHLTTPAAVREAVRAPGAALGLMGAIGCAPCAVLKEAVGRLETELKGVDCWIFSTNSRVESHRELMADLRIRSFPTLLLYRSGELLSAWVGVPPDATASTIVPELRPQIEAKLAQATWRAQ